MISNPFLSGGRGLGERGREEAVDTRRGTACIGYSSDGTKLSTFSNGASGEPLNYLVYSKFTRSLKRSCKQNLRSLPTFSNREN